MIDGEVLIAMLTRSSDRLLYCDIATKNGASGEIRTRVQGITKPSLWPLSYASIIGTPNRIRTCSLLIRSQVLHPVEL